LLLLLKPTTKIILEIFNDRIVLISRKPINYKYFFWILVFPHISLFILYCFIFLFFTPSEKELFQNLNFDFFHSDFFVLDGFQFIFPI
jgi:hypothetical protein